MYANTRFDFLISIFASHINFHSVLSTQKRYKTRVPAFIPLISKVLRNNGGMDEIFQNLYQLSFFIMQVPKGIKLDFHFLLVSQVYFHFLLGR